MRVEERLLILKEFRFLFNEFCPVHPVPMNCPLLIFVPEIDYLRVWSSNPSYLTSKGFVVFFSILIFEYNSAFLKQLRGEVILLLFFFKIRLVLKFNRILIA